MYSHTHTTLNNLTKNEKIIDRRDIDNMIYKILLLVKLYAWLEVDEVFATET